MVKISFPSMGWSRIAFKSLMNCIPGVEVFYPPAVTSDIAKMGSKNAPEFCCFPCKITLGEFINMYEKFGIKTFVQAVDCGPCRLGFYSPVQETIMKDMGYKDVTIIPIQQADLLNFEWLNTFYRLTSVENKLVQLPDIMNGVRRFVLKAKYIETIMKLEGIIRCREIKKGDTTRVVQKIMNMLDKTDDFFDLHNFDYAIKKEFAKIPINREKKPMRVMISGEIHVFLEPYVNMDLVKKLGEEGVEVHIGNTLYDWVIHKLHLNFRRKELERVAHDYIPLDIGGEAIWILGEYIKAQEEGLDGFLHVYPFTCMPETTARGIIEGQTPDPFYLPIQFYSFDEHSGFEGMRTRLEAFIDLMKTNRESNPKFQNKYVEPPELAEIFDQPIKPKSLWDNVVDLMKPSMDLVKLAFESISKPKELAKENSVKTNSTETPAKI